MPRQEEWLKDVAIGMVKARLPMTYVFRTLFELRGHLEDSAKLKEDIVADDQGLDAQNLVEQLATTYRQSQWRCRVPFFVWFIAIPPFSLAVCLLYFGSIAMLLEYNEWFRSSPSFELPLTCAFYLGKILTPAASFYVLVWLTKTAGLRTWVHVGTVAFLALLFGITVSEFRLPSSELGGALHLHLDDEVLMQSNPGWQIAQAAIVLLLAIVEWIRSGRFRIERTLNATISCRSANTDKPIERLHCG